MLSGYIIWFIIFSVIGWIFETVFCTLNDGFYQNRGFLYGPVCPIYGMGAIVCIIIADITMTHGYYEKFEAWHIFVIGYVFSAVLEYSAHVLLEKKFHATWWDYSNMPLNLHGRICVPASTLFGLSYMFIFKYVYPFSLRMRNEVPSQIQEAVAMVLVAVLAVDTAITISTLRNFESELESMNDVVNTNMITLSKLLKEKRLENQDEETEEKTRTRMAIEIARKMAGNMSAIRVSALNRIKSYKYPRYIYVKMDTLLKEIKKRNPFYKEKNND